MQGLANIVLAGLLEIAAAQVENLVHRQRLVACGQQGFDNRFELFLVDHDFAFT